MLRELLVNIYNSIPASMQVCVNNVRCLSQYNHWKGSELGAKRIIKNMAHLKGKFSGHRCVIVGNGSSLNKTDLTLLKNEYTIGMNRIYMKFPELGHSTDILVCFNGSVLSQFHRDIFALDSLVFLNWRHAKDLPISDNAFLLNSRPGLRPAGNIELGVFNSYYTVTTTCLEIAYYFGFSEVILIGVDHHYIHPPGHGGMTVVSTHNDPNHFDPNYFGPGISWQLPNLKGSEFAYRKLRDLYDSTGRRVVDATVDGKLTVFEKQELSECLAASRYSAKSNDLSFRSVKGGR